MNDHVEGAWKQFKGKIKEQWGKLTDDDLDRVEGRWEQLSGMIQSRYARTRDDVEAELKLFRERHEKSVTSEAPEL